MVKIKENEKERHEEARIERKRDKRNIGWKKTEEE
jgi:hypothetical protein